MLQIRILKNRMLKIQMLKIRMLKSRVFKIRDWPYGQASRVTRSCGAYGHGKTPAVTVGSDGNLHPSMYVPMEKGESGTHHAACKERFVVTSGRPVQPHEPLPADYCLAAGDSPKCLATLKFYKQCFSWSLHGLIKYPRGL